MASRLSRNPNIRCICRSLVTSTQNHLRSTTTSAPPSNGVSDLLQPRLFQQSQSIISLCRESYVSSLYYRYLSTTPEKPELKKPEEAVSKGGEEEKKSESSDQTNQNAGMPVRSAPVSWWSFLLLVLSGAGVVYYYNMKKKERIEDVIKSSMEVKQGPSVGKAAIGGPFDLVDDTGKSVTDKDFLGKWNLIYFGFTHCPDICPEEMIKLAATIDKIKEKTRIEVVPIFISVDPERDTVEQVHEYVKEFHPNLIGLTGAPDEIKKVARAYRVYYMKTEEEGSDYLVDHSIIMYLMSPKMEFVKFFGKNHDVDSLTEGIITELKQYKK